MNEFKIGDYELFNTGSNEVDNTVKTLQDNIQTGNRTIDSLNNEDVFAGPICNSCVSGWESIVASLSASVEDLSKASTHLNKTSMIYQNSDADNSNEITGI